MLIVNLVGGIIKVINWIEKIDIPIPTEPINVPDKNPSCALEVSSKTSFMRVSSSSSYSINVFSMKLINYG